MSPEFASRRLRAVPFRVIATSTGVVLKRGAAMVALEGAGVEELLQDVLRVLASRGATAGDVCGWFGAPQQEAVERLLLCLSERGFLVPAELEAEPPAPTDANLGVYHWHFEQQPGELERKLDQASVALVGLNRLSRALEAGLRDAGVHRIVRVDDPVLRNVQLPADEQAISAERFIEAPLPPVDVIIAGSEFGASRLLGSWNRFCIERRVKFLPVLLKDMIGYVGPLVLPGETACYACLLARQNSNLVDWATRRACEDTDPDTQPLVAIHPAMLAATAATACFELTRLLTGVPQWRVGKLIEVNLLATETTCRRVLKVPRCSVCSPLLAHSRTELERYTQQPGLWHEQMVARPEQGVT